MFDLYKFNTRLEFLNRVWCPRVQVVWGNKKKWILNEFDSCLVLNSEYNKKQSKIDPRKLPLLLLEGLGLLNNLLGLLIIMEGN